MCDAERIVVASPPSLISLAVSQVSSLTVFVAVESGQFLKIKRNGYLMLKLL